MAGATGRALRRWWAGSAWYSASAITARRCWGRGTFFHAGQGKTFIGEMDDAVTPRVQKIAEAFKAAGIDIEASAQVLNEIWSKLALNVATLPTSSTIKL